MNKFPTIDAGTLSERLASDNRPVLINALAREAFDDERIPGSISIPASYALRVADDLLAKDQAIVVYCASRSCTASPTLAQKLIDLGFSDVSDFAGGIEEWERTGYIMQRTRVMATA